MFTNVYNFRDLSTADSHRLKPGRVYRSDSLARFDDTDWNKFRSLRVRTVVDLRLPEEVSTHGRVRAAAGQDYHNLSIMRRMWDTATYDDSVGVARYLADRYLEITEDGAGEIATALRLLAEADHAPAVLHCAGGKDRTGVMAALILSLVGIGDEAIAADYARTAETSHLVTAHLHQAYGFQGAPPPFSACPPEAILAFLADLRARHGSVARFAASIGVPEGTIRSLRAHMVAG
ncbi:tyrosine-protein phosphatase [Longispora albida]|uniref:tyrosine-protein phosphatase n=1 Tax=Longispora albida TaxID=203523 RepID=UPI000370E9E4|nr:tyrosine-protein phosphatase [Longispora albida]